MTTSFQSGIVLAVLFALAPTMCFAQEKAKEEPGKLTLGLGVCNQGMVVKVKLEKSESNLNFDIDVVVPGTLPGLVEQLVRKMVESRTPPKEAASVIRLSPRGFDDDTMPVRAETRRELEQRSVELGLVQRVY
jgi:hypothetical protein